MPTKKRRVGFIPRSDVLDLINKLSFESNLSISKIINILVEEALYKRGIYNFKIDDKDNSNEFKIFKNIENQHTIEERYDYIDKEIYAKFLMFLQFQEKMKKMD